MKKVFVLTGEPSGDKLASTVISKLKLQNPNIEYLSYSELEKVRLSLVIAYYAHYNQKRLSSEKFIIHPYNVAIILSELKCDSDTIIGGILHSVISYVFVIICPS